MKSGYNTYVLTESRMNPSWQLRHNNVLIEDGKKGLRRIRYARGAKSIFDDEIPEVLKTTPIDFTEGKFEAPLSDVVLNKYLQSHPEYEKKYKLLDPDRDAEVELAKIDLVDEAKDILRKMSPDKQVALAAVIFGDRYIRGWKEPRIRLELNKFLEDTETLVESGVNRTQYFINKANDPHTEVQFLVLQALREEVIAVSPDKTSVLWKQDGGVIMRLAVGESPVRKMADLLMSKEGRTTLQELGKRLG